uniref:RRM domain-containing protein n=1 Tax=Timema monikensis TaxID=170555 RepID=A0A7R9E4F6_9NEOP|nr:unnamed protein product [Timema monikensis]
MSIDPGELVQAGPPLYEVSSGDNTTTYIPTTSAGSVGFMVMSYPGRPPMVPGMPPMPPTMGMQYMQLGGKLQSQTSTMIPGPPLPPMPPMRQFRPHPNHNMHHNNSGGGGGGGNIRPNSFTKRQQEPPGPPVTVFVGNITERAPDAMIRHILSACGHVVSWKRVQAFGFCEFGSPDSGLRAIRLLHDMQVGDKQLVVKVDAKTKTVLDEYKAIYCESDTLDHAATEAAERRRKLKGRSPLQDETPDEEDYMDDMMKHTDKMAIDRIMLTMEDYESDMTNFSSPSQTRRQRGDSEDRKISRTQEKLIKLSQAQGEQQDPPPSDASVLEDVDIEEGKRDLITREIGKFREIMKTFVLTVHFLGSVKPEDKEKGIKVTVSADCRWEAIMALISGNFCLTCSCKFWAKHQTLSHRMKISPDSHWRSG